MERRLKVIDVDYDSGIGRRVYQIPRVLKIPVK